MTLAPQSTPQSTGRERGLYQPYPCRLDSVRDLTPSEKLLCIRRLDGQPFQHQPGQFLQVSLPGLGEAPISVSSSPTRTSHVELAVRKVGAVTSGLHRLEPGDSLGLRGPFGHGFDTDAMSGRDLLLVAGGCGLAPMRSLVQFVEDRRDQFAAVTLLYGAKSPADLLYRDELEYWRTSEKLDCHITVDAVPDDQVWTGRVGLITNLVTQTHLDPQNAFAVIVGPPVMYRFVIEGLAARGLPPERTVLSLERHMKCGVGKCGHCSIDHLYCCLDGPVFTLDQLAHVKGAI